MAKPEEALREDRMEVPMTIFYTVCISLAIARFVEVFIRFCAGYLSRFFIKKKVVHVPYQKRISAYVDPELHTMIKAYANMLDLTITDYILLAVNEKMERDARG
jgi:hypothetical protein